MQTILETLCSLGRRKLKVHQFNYFLKWRTVTQSNIQTLYYLKRTLLSLVSLVKRFQNKQKTKFLVLWSQNTLKAKILDYMQNRAKVLEKHYKSELTQTSKEIKLLSKKQEQVQTQASNLRVRKNQYKSQLQSIASERKSPENYEVKQLQHEVNVLQNSLQFKEQQVILFFDELSASLPQLKTRKQIKKRHSLKNINIPF